MIPRPLALGIVTVVTVVWAVTITAPLWRPGAPEPNPAINFVFMIVVGGALGLTRGGNGTISRVLGALRPPPADPPTPAPPSESEQP